MISSSQKQSKEIKPKTPLPFYKKRLWKVLFLIVAVFSIALVSFVAYIYSQGIRIFDDGVAGGTPFFRTIKSSFADDAQLKGEKEGRVNILFMGIGGVNHPGGQLTDSLMLVSLKPEDGSLAMMSIPRDLYVPVANHKTKTKINEVVAIGEKEREGSGAMLLSQTVSEIFEISVDYYVSVDFAGFIKLIDEVGGVDVDVEKTIYDPYYPDNAMKGYEPFYIKAGQHHLNGEIALKYARSRQTSSDFDRAGRQQKIAIALKEKILSLGFLANPKKILDTFTILGDHVRTNISPSEIKPIADLLKKVDNNKVVSQVLSNGEGGPLVSDSSTGVYYLLPKENDYSKLADIAENIFSPEYVAKETVEIEVLNGSGTSGLALKLAEALETYDYKVVNVGNTTDVYEKTVIYDYSAGKKKNTLEFLKTKLGAEIVEKTEELTSGADISVIIGKDFKGLETEPKEISQSSKSKTSSN